MKNTIKTNTPESAKDYWRTSDLAYRDACYLCGIDGFHVDVAASKENKKCEYFVSEDDNALLTTWNFDVLEFAWCNPPFSRKAEFLQKAYSERFNINTCMMLPYEPCTGWWRDNVDGKAVAVFVPDGRYNFCHPETGEEIKGVNFASAFVVFTSLKVPTQYIQFKRGISKCDT